ncbi:MAG: signal peptide peptidase SppA [Puniceicoccales bacterium]|jgi:protease-4|nr:signal peptide peptidase SppA [Puniceicoccales bacterium]
MKDFFKSLLAVVIGNFLTLVVVCVAFFLFFAAFLVSVSVFFDSGRTSVMARQKAFLVLDLNMTISDTPEQTHAFRKLISNSGSHIGLWDLTSALNTAAKDNQVGGIFITGNLESENYGSGFAALSEVRRALLDFKKTNKPIIAYLDSPTLKNYYLASVANEVLIHPHAELAVHGLASNNFYLGNALKKHGIGVQTTKVGEYKAAVEIFTSDKMSDADRGQRQAFLNNVWGDITAAITTSRNLPAGTFAALANEHGLMDAELAKKLKLVDKIAYRDEVIEFMKKTGTFDPENNSFAQINIRDYARANLPKGSHGNPVIAIVYAEGEIVDGPADAMETLGVVNGDALSAQLRELRNNGNVAAVVLRVNSPGGSAFASEVIQREVRLFARSGRPLVVSMGSLAASGGYWISTYADKIFAEKNTLTGSIGVFGLMFNIEEIARNIGISFDSVKTSRFADIMTLTRPKSPEELALLQGITDKIYTLFIEKVAEGRKLERAQVEKIAKGRIWSGGDAVGVGLVDAEGGLRDAVNHAIVLAAKGKDRKQFVVRQYPEQQTVLEALSATLHQSERKPPIGSVLAPIPSASGRSVASKIVHHFDNLLRHLEKTHDRNGVYARLPWWEME